MIVFALNATGGPLWRVPAAGGTPALATKTSPATRGDRMPWFLPDGRHFLYIDFQERPLIRVGSLDEPDKVGKEVARASSQAVFDQGRLLFLREETLMSQPFDLGALAVTGEPAPIAEQVNRALTPPLPASFSVRRVVGLCPRKFHHYKGSLERSLGQGNRDARESSGDGRAGSALSGWKTPGSHRDRQARRRRPLDLRPGARVTIAVYLRFGV